MEDFDWISIEKISKKDMMLIIYALEYISNKTNISDFEELKNDLIDEISVLANISKTDFILALKKETQSL